MTKLLLSRNNQPNQPINTIHLGLGAFYRAFCCHYFQKINELKKDSIIEASAVNPVVSSASRLSS